MRWETLYPPFGLALRLGPVELRPARQEDLPELLELIAAGVVSPDVPQYPLSAPFALGEDSQERRLQSLRFWWTTWAESSPADWCFNMAVRRDGELVGVQDLFASNFACSRSAQTGSWLVADQQGRGTGTLMRQAVCMFAFDHLKAQEVISASFHDNARSIAVSRKVGFQPNGQRRARRGDGWFDDELVFRLTPEHLVRPEFPLEVDGLERFLRFIGLTKGAASQHPAHRATGQ